MNKTPGTPSFFEEKLCEEQYRFYLSRLPRTVVPFFFSLFVFFRLRGLFYSALFLLLTSISRSNIPASSHKTCTPYTWAQSRTRLSFLRHLRASESKAERNLHSIIKVIFNGISTALQYNSCMPFLTLVNTIGKSHRIRIVLLDNIIIKIENTDLRSSVITISNPKVNRRLTRK